MDNSTIKTYFDYNLFDTLNTLISLYAKRYKVEYLNHVVEEMILKYEIALIKIMTKFNVPKLYCENYAFSLRQSKCGLKLDVKREDNDEQSKDVI